jgi:hypothetical protein
MCVTEIYTFVPSGEQGCCHYDGVISAGGKKRLCVLGHILNHRRPLPGMIPVDSNNT